MKGDRRVWPLVAEPTEEEPNPEPTMWAWELRLDDDPMGECLGGFARTRTGAEREAALYWRGETA